MESIKRQTAKAGIIFQNWLLIGPIRDSRSIKITIVHVRFNSRKAKATSTTVASPVPYSLTEILFVTFSHVLYSSSKNVALEEISFIGLWVALIRSPEVTLTDYFCCCKKRKEKKERRNLFFFFFKKKREKEITMISSKRNQCSSFINNVN